MACVFRSSKADPELRPERKKRRLAAAKADRREARVLTVLEVARAVFQPLAKLLIENGVSSPEAEALYRAVCIHEAAAVHRTGQGKANVSLVSLLTGIDRGDVGHILKHPPQSQSETETRRHRVNRVLAAWHSDRRFLRSDGLPLELSSDPTAIGAKSFWRLVKAHAPGVYPGLVLAELKRVGAVEEANGTVRVRRREYQVARQDAEGLSEIGARVRDLIETMRQNLTESRAPLVCQTVETMELDEKYLPLIRKAISQRCETLVTAVQSELESPRWRKASDNSTNGPRIGVTVYAYEERSQGENANEKSNDSSKTPLKRRTRIS